MSIGRGRVLERLDDGRLDLVAPLRLPGDLERLLPLLLRAGREDAAKPVRVRELGRLALSPLLEFTPLFTAFRLCEFAHPGPKVDFLQTLFVLSAELVQVGPLAQQVLDLLQDLNRELGLTVLIVDQDVLGVLSIAEYCYILEQGHVVFDGPSRELLQHGDVQEFYLGKAEGEERGYRHVKQYRRVRRWY